MNRAEIKEYLEKASASGIRPGLDRMRELMRRLGDPQDEYPVIHVAGTNGKGSTSAYLVSILLCAGKKVGWYASPAVIDERDTIKIIDGAAYDFSAADKDVFDKAQKEGYLSDESYEQIMTDVIESVEMMGSKVADKPTVYELETAGAFAAFAQENVDVAVIEVGMGGRNDATNVINKSAVSVITPIGLDHMQYLGSSVSQIAGEKAGIIPQDGVAVTYQPGVRMGMPGMDDGELPPEKLREAARTRKRQERMRGMIVGRIRVEAEDKNADFKEVMNDEVTIESSDLNGITFEYSGKKYHTCMSGLYQPYNAALALEAIDRFEAVDDSIKAKGIEIAHIPARFDTVREEPTVIYDGAHNPDGVFVLAESIRAVLGDRKIYGIMGVFRDKAAEDMVRTIAPFLSAITTVRAPGARGMEAEPLAALIESTAPELPVKSGGADIAAVLDEVIAEAKKDDAVVLVFGSLSMAEAVYSY